MRSSMIVIAIHSSGTITLVSIVVSALLGRLSGRELSGYSRGVRQLSILGFDSRNILSLDSSLIRRNDVLGFILIAEIIFAEEDAGHGIDLAVLHVLFPQSLEHAIRFKNNRLMRICSESPVFPRHERRTLNTERKTETGNGWLHIIREAVVKVPPDAFFDLVNVSLVNRRHIPDSERMLNELSVIAGVIELGVFKRTVGSLSGRQLTFLTQTCSFAFFFF